MKTREARGQAGTNRPGLEKKSECTTPNVGDSRRLRLDGRRRSGILRAETRPASVGLWRHLRPLKLGAAFQR